MDTRKFRHVYTELILIHDILSIEKDYYKVCIRIYIRQIQSLSASLVCCTTTPLTGFLINNMVFGNSNTLHNL